MFLSFYGLREQPFGVTADPRYLYLSTVHREALASLVYGIESGLGFSTLIAEPGMGKTTLLNRILSHFRSSARTAFIFETQCNARELLRNLLLELEIEDADGAEQDNVAQLNRLKRYLLDQVRNRRRVLLVLDEAQNLDDSVLESVRLLSNFETFQTKLLHIILSGQPQLAQKIARPELAQLRQRINQANRLRPLPPEETLRYMAHRLKLAGFSGQTLFTPEALAMIVGWSRGVPREINRLCFNSLSLGYAVGKHEIDAEILREVTTDLDFASDPSTNVAIGALDSCASQLAAQFRSALNAAPAVVEPIPLTQRDSVQFASAPMRYGQPRVTAQIAGPRADAAETDSVSPVVGSNTLHRTPQLRRASEHQNARTSDQTVPLSDDTERKKDAWEAFAPAARACDQVAAARPALIGLLMLLPVLGLWFLLGNAGASGRLASWMKSELRSRPAATSVQKSVQAAASSGQEDNAVSTKANESAKQQ